MKAKIQINGNDPARQQLAARVAHDGIPAGAHELYRARNTVAWIETPDGPVNIKRFHTPFFVNGIIYTTLRQSKARRSFDYARRLRELGIQTPEPIASIEIVSGPRLLESYYLSRQIEASDLRCPELRPDERPLLEALGREMARLHDAGVHMLDFSPGNILFTRDDSGDYRFSYVDLNRTLFGVTDRSRLMEMFRSIVVEPRQTEIIARAYADAVGAEGAEAEAIVADALRRHARFQKRLRRRRSIKRILMPWKKKYRS